MSESAKYQQAGFTPTEDNVVCNKIDNEIGEAKKDLIPDHTIKSFKKKGSSSEFFRKKKDGL